MRGVGTTPLSDVIEHAAAAGTPLRIVLGIGTLQLGGAEHQLARLACELHDRGHHVTVFALSADGPLRDDLEHAGVAVRVGEWLEAPPWLLPKGIAAMSSRERRLRTLPTMPIRQVGRALRRLDLRRAVARCDPQVVHAWLPGACVALLPLAVSLRVPVRVGGWRAIGESVDVAGQGRVARELIARSAHAAVANSSAVARDLAVRRPAPARIEVIPNGVDIPAAPADPGAADPVGVIVANLTPWKGHADLVRALASLPAAPRMRFVGDGPERPAIEQALATAGLTDRVELLGRIPDGRAQYLAAQFAVLASHHEGLPNAVLEAMAAGLPTVATAVGGVPELITDGVDGLLVPPHDPHAMAAAIDTLVRDADLRVRLGHAARRKATDFGWQACTDRYLALYRELLGTPR